MIVQLARSTNKKEQILSFTRIPAHYFVPNSAQTDALATPAHSDEPFINIQLIHDARQFARAHGQGPQPRPDVTRRSSPHFVRLPRISRTASCLLHRLRVDRAFMQEMFLLRLADEATVPLAVPW